MIQFTLLKTFLASRIGRYALLLLGLMLAVSSVYVYGYSNGQEALKSSLSKQYAVALEKATKEALEKQKALYEVEIDYLKKQVQIKEASEQSTKVIEKIVKANPKVNDKILKDDEVKAFNDSLLEIRKARTK